MSAPERAVSSAPVEEADAVTDLPSVISEKNEKARQLAKGLLEITCAIQGISVTDYINNFRVPSRKRTEVIKMTHELNKELDSPIPLDMLRSTLMWPPLPIPQEEKFEKAKSRKRVGFTFEVVKSA